MFSYQTDWEVSHAKFDIDNMTETLVFPHAKLAEYVRLYTGI